LKVYNLKAFNGVQILST